MSFDIKARRQELGLTLEEVGRFVGVSKGTVKKWESGFIKNMRRDKIVKLANILNASPMEFLSDEFLIGSAIHKKMHLNKEQFENFEALILSVFGTAYTNTSVVVVRENTIALMNPQNEIIQNLLDCI